MQIAIFGLAGPQTVSHSNKAYVLVYMFENIYAYINIYHIYFWTDITYCSGWGWGRTMQEELDGGKGRNDAGTVLIHKVRFIKNGIS